MVPTSASRGTLGEINLFRKNMRIRIRKTTKKDKRRTLNFQHRTLNGKDEETNDTKLRSRATSLFEVGSWTFDVQLFRYSAFNVGRSMFEVHFF